MAEALERVTVGLGLPASITVHHGTEFMSKALDDWAWRRGVKRDFIPPGRPNESFNGRLRDECLNVNQFVSMEDARGEIEAWRQELQSHSAPRNLTPSEFAQQSQQTRTDEGSKFSL